MKKYAINKRSVAYRAIKAAGWVHVVQKALRIKSDWSIYKWMVNGRIPANRVLHIEALTGGRYTRHQIRPDIYGNRRTTLEARA